MPNGRPLDHPLTDMLDHGLPSCYPDDVFLLVKQVSELPNFLSVKPEVESLLWDNWPQWENITPDLDHVRKRLNEIITAAGPLD